MHGPWEELPDTEASIRRRVRGRRGRRVGNETQEMIFRLAPAAVFRPLDRPFGLQEVALARPSARDFVTRRDLGPRRSSEQQIPSGMTKER